MNISKLQELKTIVQLAIDDNYPFDQDDVSHCVMDLVKQYGAKYGYEGNFVSSNIQCKCKLTNNEFWYIVGMSDSLDKGMNIPYLADLLGFPQPSSFNIIDVLIRIDNVIERARR